MRLSEANDTVLNSVVWLAARGFSGKLIAAQCDLSASQVYKICAKHGVSVKTYRNGGNKVAKAVIRVNPYVVTKQRRKAA